MRPALTPLRTVMVVMGCLAVLTACTGDGDVTEGADEAPASEESDAAEGAQEPPSESPGDGSAEEGDEQAAAGDPDAGLTPSELQAMFSDVTAGPARVVYELEGPGSEELDRLTIAQEDERQSTLASGPGGGFFALVTDEGLVVCVDEGSWECFSFDEGEQDQYGFQNLFLAENLFDDVPDFEDAQLDVTEVREITVAGRDAICLRATDTATGGAGAFCLDRLTGILLRSAAPGGGVPFILDAVEFSAPSDDDFTPPAEPTSMSDMLGR